MAEFNKDPQSPMTQVMFFGRTLSEYVKMYELDLSLWKNGKILDCPAGPSSFVAEANKLGLNVVGCDPLFTDDLKSIAECGKLDLEKTTIAYSNTLEFLSNKFYHSVESIRNYSTSALEQFLADYTIGKRQERYIKAKLPYLPFLDRTFDLVLSSNFLFLYSDLANHKLKEFDYNFHLQAVLELFRVSKQEVRIFPINRYGQIFKYVDRLLIDLQEKEIKYQIKSVDYEIFNESNLMLCLIR